MFRFLIVCIAVFVVSPVKAGSPAPFFDFSSAKVLPKGVRNLRLKSLFLRPENRLGGSGKMEPLGNAFNSEVSFQKLVDGKPALNQRGTHEGDVEAATTAAFLKSHGLENLGVGAGQTTGELNLGLSVVTPVLAYGVSRKLTLALAIPIYSIKSDIKTGFVPSEKLKEVAKALVDEGKTNEYTVLQDSMSDPIGKKLRDYGYNPLKNKQGNYLGDIKLVGKYLLSQKEDYLLTVQADLTVPTGKKYDPNDLLNLGASDGQVDVGGAFAAEYKGPEKFSFVAMVGALSELPQTMAYRIPEEEGSSVTPDIDAKTKRDIGDHLYSQWVANYSPVQGLTLSSAYGFHYKAKDRYYGNAYSDHRYQWMSKGTSATMHSVQLGLGYSTIPLFQAKKFAVPLEAAFNYTHILVGRNVTKDPLVSFDLAMYF